MRVVALVAVVDECARDAVEQVESRRGSYPQAPLPVIEEGVHLVAHKRVRIARVVAEDLLEMAVAIQAMESGALHADPDGAVATLEHLRDIGSARCVRICGREAKMAERVSGWRELIETLIGAYPEVAGGIEREGRHVIADQGSWTGGVVTQVLEAARSGIEHVEPGVTRPDPHPPLRVDRERTHFIARQGVGIIRLVLEHREIIRQAVPPRDAPVPDRDPEIVARPLHGLTDECARQGMFGSGRIPVAGEVLAVIA